MIYMIHIDRCKSMVYNIDWDIYILMTTYFYFFRLDWCNNIVNNISFDFHRRIIGKIAQNNPNYHSLAKNNPNNQLIFNNPNYDYSFFIAYHSSMLSVTTGKIELNLFYW